VNEEEKIESRVGDERIPGSNVGKREPVLPGDPFAADLRGFGIVGILSILLILLGGNIFVGGIVFIPLGGILALIWTLRSKTPWSALGYIRPKSWMVTVVVGLVFGIGLKLFMKIVVMPLLGADAINPTYHFLSGNKPMLPLALLFMVVAGISEETVFRGFLFERFNKLFSPGPWSKTFIVLITAGLFAMGHLADQGLVGFEQAAIVGLIYGVIYTRTRKIWMLIIAHAAFDITAILIIYWKIEWETAHFFFK
jgi:membrane protease YdiL (CAAX protease family)